MAKIQITKVPAPEGVAGSVEGTLPWVDLQWDTEASDADAVVEIVEPA